MSEPGGLFYQYVKEELMPDSQVGEIQQDNIHLNYYQNTLQSSQKPLHEMDLFQAVMKCMRQGVICTDPDGSVIEINGFAEELLQMKRDEVLGQRIFDLHPDPIKVQLAPLWDDFLSNPIKDLKLTGRWSEERWIEIRLSALFDQQQAVQGVIINYIDQTEKKQLEEQQQSLELKLIQEHKLSAIGILASGIAHNLNGPLSVIIGYMDLLYSHSSDLEELPIILSQGERMKDIISNMMIKSRHEQDTRMKSISLNTLLQNELKFLEANLEFKHRIDKHYEFSPNLPCVYGMYSDFSQCFLNIINNAIDAMYDSPIKTLIVKTDFDKENLYIIIRDSGYGLDPNDSHKLFNPFFTTKPAIGEAKSGQPTGTGLGLSSTYQLISKYNGTITVDGSPGKGAEFRVAIPIECNLPPQAKTPSFEELESLHSDEF